MLEDLWWWPADREVQVCGGYWEGRQGGIVGVLYGGPASNQET